MRYERGQLFVDGIPVRMSAFGEYFAAVVQDIGGYEIIDFTSGMASLHGGKRSDLTPGQVKMADAIKTKILASDHFAERKAEYGAERDRLERKARAVAAIKNAGFASIEEAVAAMLAAAALNQSEIDRLLAFAGTSSPNAVADAAAAPAPSKPRRRKSSGGDA
jgi:ribosomal protein L13